MWMIIWMSPFLDVPGISPGIHNDPMASSLSAAQGQWCTPIRHARIHVSCSLAGPDFGGRMTVKHPFSMGYG